MSRFLIVAVLLASGITAGDEKANPKAVEQLPVFHAQFPARIPLPVRTRIYVKPEAVGVDKACSFPTVKVT